MTQEWALGDSLPSGYGVAFSADGQTMVSVSRDQLAIWDAKTQSIIRKVTGLNIRNPSSATVAIDPLGKYVAVDDRDNYVRIWELATGRPHLTTDRHHQDHVRGTWSPDGATIATGDGRGDIRIWNAGSGTLVKHVPRGPSWGISALRYVEGGKQLLLCGDEPDGEDAKGPVQWLDAISGERLREQVLDTRARLATPSPDQSLIAVGTEPGPEPGMRERSIRLLDGRSGRFAAKLRFGGRWLVALGWSADGKELLAAAGGKVLRAPIDNLDAVSETELPHVQRDQHGDLVPSQFFRAIFLNGGQRIVTAGGLPEVFCWNLLASEREWSCPLPDRNIRGFALSPDERMLACLVGVERKGNSLRLVDLSAGAKSLTTISAWKTAKAWLSPPTAAACWWASTMARRGVRHLGSEGAAQRRVSEGVGSRLRAILIQMEDCSPQTTPDPIGAQSATCERFSARASWSRARAWRRLAQALLMPRRSPASLSVQPSK